MMFRCIFERHVQGQEEMRWTDVLQVSDCECVGVKGGALQCEEVMWLIWRVGKLKELSDFTQFVTVFMVNVSGYFGWLP